MCISDWSSDVCSSDLMAVAYILVALVIMAFNWERVPAMFELIMSSAFGLHAGFGPMLGLAVEWGVKRGIYPNAAGQGTGPPAAAAAAAQHPAQQGFVLALAVGVDPLLVCSAPASVMLAAGLYHLPHPATAGRFLQQALPH